MAAKGFAKVIIVITTISAAIMELLDTSIVNVALFNMAGSLGVNIEDVAWVITAFAIANVVIIPLSGFLGQYFGRKKYYIFSMILFTAASYACGAANSLGMLIFCRFMQGIGGGALLSTSQAILFEAFEPKDRAIAGGIFGMGIVLGPTLGPTVGGLIMEKLSWPWIFYVNLPVGIIATILAINFVPEGENEGQNKANISIDYVGILTLIMGVGSLQYVLERGEAEDWFASSSIQFFTMTAIIGIIGFIYQEITTPNPAVNIRILANRTQAITNITAFVVGIGLFTSVYVFPVLVQRINGFTAYETGLAILFPTLIGCFVFPFIGKAMASGAPPLPFMLVGCIMFFAFGMYGGTMNGAADRWDFFYVLILRTFGISMMQLPLINQSVAGLSPKDYPSAISLSNMTRQLGGAFGVAIANNYIATHFAQHRTDLVANMNVANPAFTERLTTVTQGIIARTGATLDVATQQAYGVLDFTVNKQAYMLSYLDTFRLISVFFALVFPLLFFIPKVKPVIDEAKKKAMEDAH
jgi:MFS transporter, DHA2 family, multidrug resistance protein